MTAAVPCDPPVLCVQGLRHAWQGQSVLADLRLQLARGEIRGLIGANGAGKSTLLRLLAGVLPVQDATARIHVAGIDLRQDPDGVRRHLGWAPEPKRLPPGLSARQCLEVVALTRGLASIPVATLEQAQALGLSRWLEAPVGQLSLGSRQKVAVLQALLGAPALLVLDEVLNGLDPLACHALKQILRELAARGSAILLSTHGLETAVDLLHSADVLVDGRLAMHFDALTFAGFRRQGVGAFEAAVVRALRGD